MRQEYCILTRIIPSPLDYIFYLFHQSKSSALHNQLSALKREAHQLRKDKLRLTRLLRGDHRERAGLSAYDSQDILRDSKGHHEEDGENHEECDGVNDEGQRRDQDQEEKEEEEDEDQDDKNHFSASSLSDSECMEVYGETATATRTHSKHRHNTKGNRNKTKGVHHRHRLHPHNTVDERKHRYVSREGTRNHHRKDRTGDTRISQSHPSYPLHSSHLPPPSGVVAAARSRRARDEVESTLRNPPTGASDRISERDDGEDEDGDGEEVDVDVPESTSRGGVEKHTHRHRHHHDHGHHRHSHHIADEKGETARVSTGKSPVRERDHKDRDRERKMRRKHQMQIEIAALDYEIGKYSVHCPLYPVHAVQYHLSSIVMFSCTRYPDDDI
jgi:hypothetical protein